MVFALRPPATDGKARTIRGARAWEQEERGLRRVGRPCFAQRRARWAQGRGEARDGQTMGRRAQAKGRQNVLFNDRLFPPAAFFVQIALVRHRPPAFRGFRQTSFGRTTAAALIDNTSSHATAVLSRALQQPRRCWLVGVVGMQGTASVREQSASKVPRCGAVTESSLRKRRRSSCEQAATELCFFQSQPGVICEGHLCFLQITTKTRRNSTRTVTTAVASGPARDGGPGGRAAAAPGLPLKSQYNFPSLSLFKLKFGCESSSRPRAVPAFREWRPTPALPLAAANQHPAVWSAMIGELQAFARSDKGVQHCVPPASNSDEVSTPCMALPSILLVQVAGMRPFNISASTLASLMATTKTGRACKSYRTVGDVPCS